MQKIPEYRNEAIHMIIPNEDRKSIEAEIREIIAIYVQAIDEANTALAAKIWLDSPEVSFVHPRGHEHGWKEIKENFFEGLMGSRFSKRKLTVYDISVKIFGETVFAEFYWDFDAVFTDGTPKQTAGRETQVFARNENSEWVLVHVHYSNMPVTGEREGV